MEKRDEPEADEPEAELVYVDASGAVVDDPARAVAGEIVEQDGHRARRKRAWFRIKEVELAWLPVRESAFLLWVMALLALGWLALGLYLHFT